MSSKIHIVIVNYRSADYAVDCLGSLQGERESGVDFRVTLVDADSGDDSVGTLRDCIQQRRWHEWVTLLPLANNGGFARGNNLAIATSEDWPSRPKYTLLLNPDTKIRPGAIAALAAILDENPRIGIAGSRLEWENGEGQRAARRFPSVASELESTMRFGPVSRLLAHRAIAPVDPAQACETEWVVGASMMIRQEVFDDIGLLDEDYFLYFEEVDFCLRAKRAGWQNWYVPDSRVVHYVGTSTGVTSSEKKGRCPTYWFESRRRYFLKNHGRVVLWGANLASVFGLSMCHLRHVFGGGSPSDHQSFLGDFVRFNFFRQLPVFRS